MLIPIIFGLLIGLLLQVATLIVAYINLTQGLIFLASEVFCTVASVARCSTQI